MGALRKAKEACRKLIDVFHSATTWNKQTGAPEKGFTAFPHSFWSDINRLSRGHRQGALITQAWVMTCGMRSTRDAAVPELSDWISVQHLAEVIHCSEDQVWDDAREAKKRGVLRMEERRGEIRIGCDWQRWPNLKDYVPGPSVVPKPKPEPTPTIGMRWRRPVSFSPGRAEDVKFTAPRDAVRIESKDLDGCSIVIGESEDSVVVRLLATKANQSPNQKSKELRSGKTESTPETATDARSETAVNPTSNEGEQPEVRLTFSSPLAEVLADYGILSELSADRLVRECQTYAPESSLEQIIEAVRAIGDGARGNSRARNVSGIVLAQVPKWFGTPAYRAGKKPGAPAVEKKPAISARDQKVFEAMEFTRRHRGKT